MHLLSVDGLAKAHEDTPLFRGVRFGLSRGDRLGVVGPNGSGKSTLLRVLAGRDEPDSGSVVWARDVSVAVLDQEAELDPDATIVAAVLAADTPERRAAARYESAAAAVAANPDDAALAEELAAASSALDAAGGWATEHRAHAVLDRLGFAGADLARRCGELSGGQRRRVALARTLLADADVVILDEPTNHLDADTVEWLEGELRRFGGALVLVTHDRYFLERLTNRLLELDRGDVFVHQGGYSTMLEARLARDEHAKATERRRANLLRTELAWVQRRPKARSSKPRFRLEQAEALAAQTGPEERTTLALGTGKRRLGNIAFSFEGVGFAYGDRQILRNVDFECGPGDRIGVVGPNGSGKTTLLKLLAGELRPDAGTLWRSPTVELAHYRQDTIVEPEGRKVIDLVTEVAEWLPLADGSRISASQMAERFLFDTKAQHRSVSVLSGGERRRLALLRTLVEAPNVLLLDEPTNDLDLDTLAVLEDHLDGFGGVLVVASHDRYLLNRLCDRFVAVDAMGALRTYPGDWDTYRAEIAAEQAAQSAAERVVAKAAAPTRTRAKSKLSYSEQRERDQLGAAIEQLASRRDELTAALAAAASDHVRLTELGAELTATEAELAGAEDRWLELELLAEELGSGT